MSDNISRRRFLEGVAAVAGVALVGCSQSEPSGPLQATAGAGGSFELSGVGDLSTGQGMPFNFPDGQPGIIFKTANGKVSAVNAHCTHAGCTVEWRGERNDGPLFCACHSSKFSTTGAVQGGPAKSDLPFFAVSLADGKAVLKPA